MKKFLIFTIIAIIAILTMTSSVQATENVAKVGKNTYATLELAYEAVTSTNNEITLLDDIVLDSSLEISNNITIDLNGHSITPSDTMTEDSLIIVLHGGKLIIEDSSSAKTGKISATDSTNARVGIKMTKAGGDTSKTATLIVNSGIIEGTSFGISGNGSANRINTDITINGGTIKAVSGSGIYHPQDGNLTVNGGTIQGLTGIEMRSGNLTVTGGTIIGTAVPSSSTANGNGATTLGAGIAIAQHTTKKNISVDIKGGTIQGYTAVYESNPQNNNTMDKISIKISGGKFKTINGGTEVIISENKTGFITGGTFNTEVEEKYLSSKVTAEKGDNGEFVVGTRYDIEVNETKNGTVKVSSQKAIEGDVIELTITPEKGYKLAKIKVLSGTTEIKVTDGKFTMPATNVVIETEFEVNNSTTNETLDYDELAVSEKKSALEENNGTEKNSSGDKTVSSTKLPETGSSPVIIISIIFLLLIMFILNRILNNFKDIK